MLQSVRENIWLKSHNKNGDVKQIYNNKRTHCVYDSLKMSNNPGKTSTKQWTKWMGRIEPCSLQLNEIHSADFLNSIHLFIGALLRINRMFLIRNSYQVRSAHIFLFVF